MGATRRGHGENAVYFDHEGAPCLDASHHRRCRGRWRGVISTGHSADGKRLRRKVSGKTKSEVLDALKDLRAEHERGLRTSRSYTVKQAVDAWLEGGLPGRSERTRSVYREATAPLLALIGGKALRELTAGDVRDGLEKLASHVSTRYLQIARQSLVDVPLRDLRGAGVAGEVDVDLGRAGAADQDRAADRGRGRDDV